jgi:hypothetical protein
MLLPLLWANSYPGNRSQRSDGSFPMTVCGRPSGSSRALRMPCGNRKGNCLQSWEDTEGVPIQKNHEECYRHHPWEDTGDTAFLSVLRDGRESMDETTTRERQLRFLRARVEGTLVSGAFKSCYTCEQGAVRPVIGKEHT